MLIYDFDFDLPAESIAQRPSTERGGSRLLVLDKQSEHYADHMFQDLPNLLRGDELVVVNNTKVIPARLFGRRAGVHAGKPVRSGSSVPVLDQASGGREFLGSRIEVLLLRQIEPEVWEALVRPGRKVQTGERLRFDGAELEAEVIGRGGLGLRQLRFHGKGDLWAAIESIGHVPLPPYIRRPDEPADRERYQTVYAARYGSVAAPTAGLHFTPAILERLKTRGIELCEITLDVGLGTFQPVHAENLEDHHIHTETYEIPARTAEALTAARLGRRPILAVGTTVVRALEDAAQKALARGDLPEGIAAGRATADIFIRPGHRFALVEQMLTNFHLPRSTLLVLVAAFAGREFTLAAYRHAVAEHYLFYSYGDCMLIR